jgi:site-specific DNA recombinase
MATQKTSIIYARVSTTRQADDGLPIESQVECCKKKAVELESPVQDIFIDAGISGRTDDRPAFKDALAFCKKHKIDYFICWSTSRFARNMVDAAIHKKDLERHGCRVIYVSVNVDNTTNSGWMFESILALFDEHYSRQVSEDTMRSMLKNAQDGYYNGGRPPMGYIAEPDGKRKRLQIYEPDAVIVREMFSLMLQGLGAKAISESLNDRGMLHRGKKWHKNSVYCILSNEAMCGYVTFNKRDRKNNRIRPPEEWVMVKNHAPIIDEDQFMDVQSLMSARAPIIGNASGKSQHAFSGMLVCGSCERIMHIESASGRRGYYFYYNCSSAMKGMGCKNHRMPADSFDEFMIDAILDKVLTTDSLADVCKDLQQATGNWVIERAKQRKSLTAEMRKVEARQRNLFNVLELHGVDAPNLGDMTTRLRELKAERENLEREIMRIEAIDAPAMEVTDQDVFDMYEILRGILTVDPDKRKMRDFFGTFIKSIVIREKHAVIEYHPEKLINHIGFDVVHSMKNWLPVQCLLCTNSVELEMPERFHQRLPKAA